ncbi:MAG TPA: hypothetical protein VMV21_20015 [Vicinamibacteria bacterium]|nr:hypothetical protein [Vicinamibacteria bacterium]
MTRLSVGEIVDDAGDLASAVALPWIGLLWLTAIPLRLGQAHFVARLVELGPEAREYGDDLGALAFGIAVLFLLSLWGRAVFVRSCALRLRGLAATGRAPLHLPPGPFLSYVYVALLIELVFLVTSFTLVMVPFCALVAGLAAAIFPQGEPVGLVRPVVRVARQGSQALPLTGLVAVFASALVLAAVNLYFVFQLGLWLAGGVAGADTTRWAGLLAGSNPRFLLVVLAGASVVVEPFWLAALVVYVHKLEARSTGEDLRLWFGRLRSGEA